MGSVGFLPGSFLGCVFGFGMSHHARAAILWLVPHNSNFTSTHDSPYISDRPSSVGLGDTNGGRIKESIPHAAGEPEIGQAGIGFGDQAREVSSPPLPQPLPL